MTSRCHVVIAGAGLVGMALAARLASGSAAGRFGMTLIDAGAPPAFSGNDDVALRVSAISSGSMQFFARLGIRDAIPATRACPYRDMRVWDAAGAVDGPQTLTFSAAEFALPELGHIVENELLRQRLYERLQTLGVAMRFHTTITAIGRAAAGRDLTLEGGERLPATLLVGADGANSAVRASAGFGVVNRRYPQDAVVAHVRPARAHRHTAWQRFLPEGPLALLPLADGRVSVVWSTTPARAASLLEMDDAAFGRALTAASDDVLGRLTAGGARASFPLRAQYVRRYVAAGLALAGDAAHTVHPLAGQGVNLGLADAAELATVLETACLRGDSPADLPVLRRYERARKGPNQAMLYVIDGLQRLFAGEAAALAVLRGTGMQLFNRSGPLRRAAMRVALGLDNARES
ncbi:MAG TPA: FAD-dependent monooxygenase [Woeseiaceae bacterium]|nr:FAD-dependent monooxygenase [Woeseiaceae bacterium]